MAAKSRVLVTGGNRGIGLAIVERFAKEGHSVLLAARDLAAGEAEASRLRAESLDVRALRLDVGEEASVEAALAELDGAAAQVSVLVNNAGILPEGTLLDMPWADVAASFAVNVMGPLRVARGLAPAMAERGYGRIVNVSSGWGSFAEGLDGPGVYGVTKAALNALTVRLARELPEAVKVNAMCPGWVRTRMGGAGAPRTPEEAADTAYWLGTLADDGPSGGFFRDRRLIAW
ncbi:MAG: SDR family NAD(P)-dependent oxidoreductase [Rhodospirillales bacterium]|nr:SDR family NAD(P)-dependent oxidoreductase [Rhodospirillales bacterium]